MFEPNRRSKSQLIAAMFATMAGAAHTYSPTAAYPGAGRTEHIHNGQFDVRQVPPGGSVIAQVYPRIWSGNVVLRAAIHVTSWMRLLN